MIQASPLPSIEGTGQEDDDGASQDAKRQMIPKQANAQQETEEFANVEKDGDGQGGRDGCEPIDAADAEVLGDGVDEES